MFAKLKAGVRGYDLIVATDYMIPGLKALNLIIAEVEAKARRPLVLIVDGLDRLSPEAGRAFFGESRFLDSLACRVVYTAPMDLYFSLGSGARHNFQIVEFPNVALHERGQRERKTKEGRRFFEEVLAKRWPSHTLEDGVLNLLVEMSGGIIRDFIRLVQEAALVTQEESADQITLAIAQEAIARIRRLYQAPAHAGVIRVLQEVRASTQPPDSPLIPFLLYDNLIVSFIDRQGVWYDAHPILGEL